jgi:16S rRNA (uracil1498-N3)-methyltransferase
VNHTASGALSNQKHLFALYCDPTFFNLKPVEIGHPFRINHEQLVHRICHVLRLKENEQLIIFDTHFYATATIVSVTSKKYVECVLLDKQSIQPIVPHIGVIMPILKRDAMEEAIYSSVELGANSIHCAHFQKEQRSWGDQREVKRLHAVMVAAAEQSKNFSLPTLYPPVALSSLLERIVTPTTHALYADPNGRSLTSCMTELTQKEDRDHILIAFGPEGGILQSEIELFQKHSFVPCRLTPTILRAQQAYCVLLGALRAMLHESR